MLRKNSGTQSKSVVGKQYHHGSNAGVGKNLRGRVLNLRLCFGKWKLDGRSRVLRTGSVTLPTQHTHVSRDQLLQRVSSSCDVYRTSLLFSSPKRERRKHKQNSNDKRHILIEMSFQWTNFCTDKEYWRRRCSIPHNTHNIPLTTRDENLVAALFRVNQDTKHLVVPKANNGRANVCFKPSKMRKNDNSVRTLP